MPIINFIDYGEKVEVVPGANLRQVAKRKRVQVYQGIHQLLNCNGNGLCGTCKMAVIDGRVMPRNDTEIKRLKGVDEPWRLACQFEVLDNITVTTDPEKVALWQTHQDEQEAARIAARQAAETPDGEGAAA